MNSTLDDLDHVFILTYGRSGSTLLLGYVNTFPGFCIRGENAMCLAHLHAFYKVLRDAQAGPREALTPAKPWYGLHLVDPERLARSLRHLFVREILNPPAGTTTTGFKEIRIGEDTLPDLDGFLDFCFEVFPRLKILFNFRDIEATSKSRWWAESEDSGEKISRMAGRMRASRFATDPRVFNVQYERFVEGPEHPAEIARFLGRPFDEDAWRQLLTVKHAHWWEPKKKDTRPAE